MTDPDVDSLLSSFCLFKTHIAMAFGFCLLLFVLSAVAVNATSPDSAEHVVSLVNVGTLAVLLVPMAIVLWHCRDVE